MKKDYAETSFAGKSFSTPTIRVVAIAGTDVISTSNEGYEAGDTSGWFSNNPTPTPQRIWQ